MGLRVGPDRTYAHDAGAGASARPAPSTWTLTGQVISSTTRQPTGGARLLGVTTDAAGLFATAGTGPLPVQSATLEAGGFVTRQTTISVGTQNPIIDLIPIGVQPFYRQLVRNGYQQPGVLQLLRRWTSNPNIYINTNRPGGGQVHPTESVAIVREWLVRGGPAYLQAIRCLSWIKPFRNSHTAR